MDTQTQRKETVHINERTCRAQGAAQWFIETTCDGVAKVPAVTYNNAIEVFICGEEAFRDIAVKLDKARHSIDIIAWGFDPAMELVRCGTTWPRGETYGELLERKAAELAKAGGKVRLLVWYSWLLQNATGNLPGYRAGHYLPATGSQAGGASESPRLKARGMDRDQYNRRWFMQAANGDMPGLELRTRNPDRKSVISSLAPEPMPRDALESAGLVGAAVDHQKTLLIDYDWQEGSEAVGYVMGLNSVTTYWDSRLHLVDDPCREVIDLKDKANEEKREKATLNYTRPKDYRTCKPLQDYICQIRGGALINVNANFCQAWEKAASSSPAPIKSIGSNVMAGEPKFGSAARKQVPAQPKPVSLPPQCLLPPFMPGRSPVQILRTYPDSQEKSIKAAYWQAVSFARRYIYIENQYFYYEEFVKHLTSLENTRRRQADAHGVAPSRSPLHIMIVIPQPERDQMVPRTYDSMRLLGQNDSMQSQHKLVENSKHLDLLSSFSPAPDLHYALKDSRKLHSPSKQELETTHGVKVSVAMLRTSNRGDEIGKIAYREIYIHSKLMIIDDSFFTLGSANLNVRSMAVDSEINMSTDDSEKAKELRNRVFMLHSGNKVSGGKDSLEMEKAFKQWADLMAKNRTKMKEGYSLEGFLLPFEDQRTSLYRLQ